MKFKPSRNSADEAPVAEDKIGEMTISTIFAGADAGRTHEGLGLYETRVFEGPLDGKGERYPNLTEAEAGHKRWLEAAKAAATQRP